jgi:hypothetical protein
MFILHFHNKIHKLWLCNDLYNAMQYHNKVLVQRAFTYIYPNIPWSEIKKINVVMDDMIRCQRWVACIVAESQHKSGGCNIVFCENSHEYIFNSHKGGHEIQRMKRYFAKVRNFVLQKFLSNLIYAHNFSMYHIKTSFMISFKIYTKFVIWNFHRNFAKFRSHPAFHGFVFGQYQRKDYFFSAIVLKLSLKL